MRKNKNNKKNCWREIEIMGIMKFLNILLAIMNDK